MIGGFFKLKDREERKERQDVCAPTSCPGGQTERFDGTLHRLKLNRLEEARKIYSDVEPDIP